MRRELRARIMALALEVDTTRREQGFREALETMAAFWRYSVFNQAFIRMQRPQASRVAGRGAWESLGRKVKPGEKPIYVFAPWPQGDALRFLAVEVYDVRQTRGRRVATLDLLLPGRTRFARLLQEAASRLGIEVSMARLPDGIAGRSRGGRIEVAIGLAGKQRASVLAHELAHEVLHQAEWKRFAELERPGPERTHAERETEAEATAYVVLSVLGLPSKAPTYIAWQGGDGRTVLRSMPRIQRAARTILAAIERPPPSPGREAREGTAGPLPKRETAAWSAAHA